MHDNSNVLFYVLFLQIGAHSPSQNEEQNTVTTNFCEHALTHTHTHTHAPPPPHTHIHTQYTHTNTHTHTHTHTHTFFPVVLSLF